MEKVSNDIHGIGKKYKPRTKPQPCFYFIATEVEPVAEPKREGSEEHVPGNEYQARGAGMDYTACKEQTRKQKQRQQPVVFFKESHNAVKRRKQ